MASCVGADLAGELSSSAEVPPGKCERAGSRLAPHCDRTGDNVCVQFAMLLVGDRTFGQGQIPVRYPASEPARDLVRDLLAS